MKGNNASTEMQASLTEVSQDILASAQAYQKSASGTHLTQKPSTALGAAGGINLPVNRTVHKNIEKALMIKGEKKAKHKETKLIGKGVHVAATLWKIDSTKNDKFVEVIIAQSFAWDLELMKPEKTNGLRAVRVFPPTTIVKMAMDSLLRDIKISFEKCFFGVKPLNW